MNDEYWSTDDVRIGHRLRVVRDMRGKTQTEVADDLGLGAGTNVTAIEKGRRRINVALLRRMADYYSVDLAYFTDPRPTDQELADEYQQQLARVAVELEQQDRAAEEAGRLFGEDVPRETPRRPRA